MIPSCAHRAARDNAANKKRTPPGWEQGFSLGYVSVTHVSGEAASAFRLNQCFVRYPRFLRKEAALLAAEAVLLAIEQAHFAASLPISPQVFPSEILYPTL